MPHPSTHTDTDTDTDRRISAECFFNWHTAYVALCIPHFSHSSALKCPFIVPSWLCVRSVFERGCKCLHQAKKSFNPSLYLSVQSCVHDMFIETEFVHTVSTHTFCCSPWTVGSAAVEIEVSELRFSPQLAEFVREFVGLNSNCCSVCRVVQSCKNWNYILTKPLHAKEI